jgi:ATP-dependent Lon protease
MAKSADLPLIILERGVLFPGAVIPVAAASPEALAVVRAVEQSGESIAIAIKKTEVSGLPKLEDLHMIGATGRIVRALKTPDDTLHLVIQGLARIKIAEITQQTPFLRARVDELEDSNIDPVRTAALMLSVKKAVREVVEHSADVPNEAAHFLDAIEEPGRLADLVTANIDATVPEKLEVLSQIEVADRLEQTLALLTQKLEVLKLSNKIESQVKDEMNKTQREYMLRQQLKAIQDQLGEGEEGSENGLEELEERIKNAHLPPEADKIAQRELKRLKLMTSAASEYSVTRTYLEWLSELPWDVKTEDRLDIHVARAILDARHYGLEKVKKRIVEFLAVRKLRQQSKGPILCLVGPPGVGKTSLAQCVADAMNRKLHRISLGGVRDEAEIRGHRRTYVGALPGRIIQGLKRAGTKNPVFVLDEVDKVAADFRGDPSSALLEVLDPEQNHTFSDHYLEVAFDLSSVLFIATANQLDTIPPALRDRMEVIEIPGYTHDEKRHIAIEHLLPKVLDAHGLSREQITLERKALDSLITNYTREAGVRNLERTLASAVRAIAVEVAEGRIEKKAIKEADLSDILGPEQFYNEMAERTEVPGVAVGLAWTPFGGDILFIEATRMTGKGNLILTGQLGSVMKESAQAAQSYLRSRTADFDVPEAVWEKTDIHVHIPAGGTPKDGPSAGVTLVTALASLILGTRVRHDVAMTGEVTLRGSVLPVGGVKEKVLAASRAGIREIILPKRNEKDLYEVPREVKDELNFHFVTRVEEVLDIALERPPKRHGLSGRAPALA